MPTKVDDSDFQADQDRLADEVGPPSPSGLLPLFPLGFLHTCPYIIVIVAFVNPPSSWMLP